MSIARMLRGLLVRKNIRFSLLVISVFIVVGGSFAYGFASAYKKYPPYAAIVTLYREYVRSQDTEERFNTINDLYFQTDPRSTIFLESPKDIAKVRAELVDLTWSGAGYPRSRTFDRIDGNVTHPVFGDMRNLKEITRLELSMEYRINSIAFLFKPREANGRALIYHAGHERDYAHSKRVLGYFLKEGYTILFFSMPLSGENNTPRILVPHAGMVKFLDHDDFELLVSDTFHPIKFFIEPVVAGLNYLEAQGFEKVPMVGLSGGAWTTYIVAALDTRISYSYPVAGSLPLYLRQNIKSDKGDFEQNTPRFYRIANYLELYLMGSYGEGRKQLQIFNKYDACCFAGIRSSLYEDAIKGIVREWGAGAFDIAIDETHREHKISDVALGIIRDDLQNVWSQEQ